MSVTQPPIRRYRTTNPRPSVFLAGSIEMGRAEEWQAKVIAKIAEQCSVIYNPRRDDWDPSWEQSIDHPEFNAQVNWELDMIEEADIVAFYFDPKTQSPITLMELGIALCTKMPGDVYVACPPGFWRKGNVDIVCERHGVRVRDSLDELITAVGGHYERSCRVGR